MRGSGLLTASVEPDSEIGTHKASGALSNRSSDGSNNGDAKRRGNAAAAGCIQQGVSESRWYGFVVGLRLQATMRRRAKRTVVTVVWCAGARGESDKER
jgi:hypothetical protein